MLASGVVWAAAISYYAFTWHSVDAFVSFLDHCPILFCDFDRHFYPQGQAILSSSTPVFGFFYSAPFALALSVFRPVPLAFARLAWGTIETASTVGLFALPLLFGRPRKQWTRVAVYACAFAFSTPILHNFKWGQVSGLVVLFILLSLWLAERNKPTLAGLALAVPTIIKYYPALFLVYFAVRREWRAIGACVAGVAGGVVLTALVLGVDRTAQFQLAANQAIETAQKAFVRDDLNSQFFPHVAARWLGRTAQTDGAERSLTLLGYAICGLNVTLLWISHRRRPDETMRWSALLLFGSTPFWVPTSWPHYFVYLPTLQLFAIDDLMERPQWTPGELARGALILASIALASSIVLVEGSHAWAPYSAGGFVFVSNLCVLVYAYSRLLSRRWPTVAAVENSTPL